VKAYLQTFMTALPDLKLTVEEIFGEGDRVFSRARLEGTNTGEFNGLPPTGRRIDIRWIMNVSHVRDGRIVEEWEILDQLELVRQLNLGQDSVLAASPTQA
jgi:predicted ester cyclase